MITVQELQTQRTVMSHTSFEQHLIFLTKVGDYFEQTIPSKLEHKFVRETELLLNDLFVRSLDDINLQAYTNLLLEALGQTGSLLIAINNKTFGFEFTKTVKLLGKTLKRIGTDDNQLVKQVSTSEVMFDELDLDSDDGSRILRVKFTLPDLLPLDEYFSSVAERMQAVELLYIIYSIVYSKEGRELINNMLSPEGEHNKLHGNSISRQYSVAKSLLNNSNVDSVRLVSVHYGSDASFDLLGVGKIVEILRDTLKDVAWRGKHEQQMAKLEQKSKEADIEHMRRETERIVVETANQKIALLERVTSLDLDKEQKEIVISALLPNLQLLTDKPVTPRLKSVSSVKKLNERTKKRSLPKPKD